MERLRRYFAPPSRSLSRWLWVAGALLTVAGAVYLLPIVQDQGNAARAADHVGELRAFAARIELAADPNRQPAVQLDQLTSQLRTHAGITVREIEDLLGGERGAAAAERIRTGIDRLAAAAAAYRGGDLSLERETRVAAAELTAAADAALGDLARWRDELQGRIRAVLILGILAVLLGALITGGGLAWAERRAGRLIRTLNESEERYRLMVENSLDGVAVHDPDGRVLMCNDALCDMLGYTREELEGVNANAYIHPDEIAQVEERRAARLRGVDVPSRYGRRLVRRDGGVIEVESSVSVLRVEDRMIGVMVSHKDVTERVAAERALSESEARLARAQEIAHIGGWSVELESHEAQASDEFFRVLGLSPGQVAPSLEAFLERTHPDDVGRVRELIGTVLDGRAVSPVQLRIVRPDGEERWVEGRAEPQKTDSGGVTRVVGTLQDVTERVVAQERLATSAAETASILDSAQDAIVFADEKGIIQRVNPAAGRMFGREASELVGQSIGVLTAEPARSEHDRYVRQYVETGEASTPLGLVFGRTIEVQAQKRDGTRFPVERIVAEVERAGGRRGFTAVIRNITERKQAERDRALAQRATVRAEFLSTMSHELRTPLNSILGFGQLLERQLSGPLNQKQMRQVEDIVGAGRYLLSLIDDVLDISKIDAQRRAVEPAPLYPGGVIAETVRGFRDAAAAKAIDLRAVMKDAPAEATLDERALRQVVSNLVENAVEFTDHGHVEVRVAEEDGRLVVTVADTGCGIAEEDHERIFEEFAQVDPGLNREHEGSGLGLAIVRRLVEAHGGSVSVESALGQGSTFTVRLPLKPPAADARPAQAEAGAER